jgi:chromosomal replication initiation ATPase DnaA
LTIWDSILDAIRLEVTGDEFRRWFSPTSYASDSGDRISVWVPSDTVARHISHQYRHTIDRALMSLGRDGTEVRFVVAGTEEDEEDEDME